VEKAVATRAETDDDDSDEYSDEDDDEEVRACGSTATATASATATAIPSSSFGSHPLAYLRYNDLGIHLLRHHPRAHCRQRIYPLHVGSLPRDPALYTRRCLP